jgi:hypothetical protein
MPEQIYTFNELHASGLNEATSAFEQMSYFELSRLISDHSTASGFENGDNTWKILHLFEGICSFRLCPDIPGIPYKPSIIIGDRRSPVPSDYSIPELEFLSNIIREIRNKKIRARVADMLWLTMRNRNINHAQVAIADYALPRISSDIWNYEERDILERRIQLCKSIGSPGKSVLSCIESEIQDAIEPEDPANSILVLGLSETAFKYFPRSALIANAAEKCLKFGENNLSDGNQFNARAFFEKASQLFKKIGDKEKWIETLVKIAGCYEFEATKGQQSNIVAAHFYEAAIQRLREIPNSERVSRQLDRKITQLRDALRVAGEHSLDEMRTVSSPGFDISDIVEWTTKRIEGKPIVDALLIFANLHAPPDIENLRKEVIAEIEEFPLSNLFPSTYISKDGRTIAKQRGTSTADGGNDDLINGKMIQNHMLDIDIAVNSRIIPAHNVISFEHIVSEADLYTIVSSSPFVPSDRARIFSLGLYLGFHRDFISAIHILVPQLENLVRYHLRNHGESTTILDENGIENEMSLSGLMKNRKVSEIFGHNLAFQLRCLFTDPIGPNLRNNLAHGLLDYHDCLSGPAIYAWWLSFKICFNTYYSALKNGEQSGQ